MTEHVIPEAILEEAADWYDRLAELTPPEQQAYSAWLLQNPLHRQAISWLQANLGEHEDALLSALAQHEDASAAVAAAQTPARAGWQRAAGGWAIAAMLLLSLLLGYPLLRQPAAPALLQTSLQTVTGEQRTAQLADGSEIHLNAGAELSVQLEQAQRQVTLKRGEAYFAVAPDRQRPFYVDAGPVKIRVVGTAFNVDRMGDSIRVTVEHGEVRVVSAGEVWQLRAGDGVYIAGDERQTFRSHSVAGWRDGWREVSDEPLADVVAHLQRYSLRPIRLQGIDQPLPFSGRYNQSDVEGTLTLIADLFGLTLQLSDEQIVLSADEQAQH